MPSRIAFFLRSIVTNTLAVNFLTQSLCFPNALGFLCGINLCAERFFVSPEHQIFRKAFRFSNKSACFTVNGLTNGWACFKGTRLFQYVFKPGRQVLIIGIGVNFCRCATPCQGPLGFDCFIFALWTFCTGGWWFDGIIRRQT